MNSASLFEWLRGYARRLHVAVTGDGYGVFILYRCSNGLLGFGLCFLLSDRYPGNEATSEQ